MAENNKTLTGLAKELAEAVGKYIVGIIAFFYVTGIMVVGLYYLNFGVSNFELLRLSYITAGAWAATPIVALALTCFLLLVILAGIAPAIAGRLGIIIINRNLTESLKDKSWLNRWLFSLLNLITLVLLCLVAFIFLGLKPRVLISENVGIVVTYSAILLAISLWLLCYLFRQPRQHLRIVSLAVLMVVFYLYYLGAFALFFYQEIPSRVGGGKPIRVQFLLDIKRNTKSHLEDAGLEFQKDTELEVQDNISKPQNEEAKDGTISCRTKDILLLFSTDKEYVLLKNDVTQKDRKVVIRLPKEVSKAIIYRYIDREVGSN